MTGQRTDDLRDGGIRWQIVAVDGQLPGPDLVGATPGPLGTACWNGYLATYALDDGRLTLADLVVGGDRPAPADGIEAVPNNPDGYDYGWLYRGLDRPIPFTGRLLVATDYLDDLPYINMGYPPAWVFAHVREHVFADGALRTTHDRSAALARVRARLGDKAGRPGHDEETSDWIGRTFSLSFDYAWPPDPDRAG